MPPAILMSISAAGMSGVWERGPLALAPLATVPWSFASMLTKEAALQRYLHKALADQEAALRAATAGMDSDAAAKMRAALSNQEAALRAAAAGVDAEAKAKQESVQRFLKRALEDQEAALRGQVS